MWILLLTIVFDYILITVLVGIATGFAALRRSWDPRKRITLVGLFLVFGLLELFFVPAILVMDATVTIGNQQIAESFGLSANTPVSDLLTVAWYDAFVWLAQGVFAQAVAARVARSVASRAA